MRSTCRVCDHPQRAQIELGLIFGTPVLVLSRRFNIGTKSLHNHRHKHLTPQLKAAILMARKPEDIDLEALARTEGESVISNLTVQRARLMRLAEMATDQGFTHQAIAAERAVTENLKLMSQLLGQLVQHHKITKTSILISSDYLNLRQVILQALKRFPDAAQAVANELAKLEAEAEAEIMGGKPLLLEASSSC